MPRQLPLRLDVPTTRAKPSKISSRSSFLHNLPATNSVHARTCARRECCGGDDVSLRLPHDVGTFYLDESKLLAVGYSGGRGNSVGSFDGSLAMASSRG